MFRGKALNTRKRAPGQDLRRSAQVVDSFEEARAVTGDGLPVHDELRQG